MLVEMLGLLSGLLLQGCFGIVAQRLARRIRVQTLHSILHQARALNPLTPAPPLDKRYQGDYFEHGLWWPSQELLETPLRASC